MKQPQKIEIIKDMETYVLDEYEDGYRLRRYISSMLNKEIKLTKNEVIGVLSELLFYRK